MIAPTLHCRLAVVIALLLLPTATAIAQNDTPGQSGVDVRQVGRWPTDKISFAGRDGKLITIAGLIRDQDDERIEIVQLGQVPGRPMYLLVRWIPRDRIRSVERLDDAQRRELKRRMFAFRRRTKISADLRDQIDLTPLVQADREYQHYEGKWFSLDSTVDQALTRHAIVLCEQMVAGFRTFIQPRKQPDKPPRIVLLNTREEYQQYQKQAGVQLQHPAFFDPHRNEIVTGGELAELDKSVKAAAQHHARLEAEYQRLERELNGRLIELTAAMEAAGHQRRRIQQVRFAARKELEDKLEPQRRKMRLADAANEAAVRRKFRVLYHEAFHGYLENYVFDKAKFNVPRWFNEGLAQVFENGMLDAGILRLDYPDPALLAALQQELKSDEPLSLVDLLTAPDQKFLVQHGDVSQRTKGLYLYSWGLAYYLMFELRVLDSEALDQYLSTNGQALHAVPRFEAFVEMPIGEFETIWRQTILKMRP